MAISGITDVRRLPIVGTVRLGEKHKNASGKEYPSKLDHFNFKDAAELMSVYGEDCREMDIIIPVEDNDVFFNQARKAYRLSGLFCSCSDMKTASRVRVGKAVEASAHHKVGDVLDPQGEDYLAKSGQECNVGERFMLPCPGDDCQFSKNKMCKGIGRLIFMVPISPKFGCYVISTTSFHTMVGLNSYIDAIRNAAGRISNIPLKLRLVPKEVAPNGKKSTVYILKLEFNGTIANLRAYKDQLLLAAPIPANALPTHEELDKAVPEDLVAHGGETLGEVVGDSAPAPEEEVPKADAVVLTPAQQAKVELADKPAPPAKKVRPKGF